MTQKSVGDDGGGQRGATGAGETTTPEPNQPARRDPADAVARTVLVIEDDDDVRFTVGVMLMGAGFTVLEAASVAEAEAHLAAREIGVALVDLKLGGDDGWALVRRLGARPDTAVLIVTGELDPVGAVRGIELGADDYITKPFRSRELVARVKRRSETVRRLRTAAAGV